MTGDAPIADGRYVAVVDRFEETDPAGGGTELAVLLVESGEEVVGERTIPRWRLPDDARRPDAVLAVTLRNGFVVSASFDSAATERRRSSAQDRFDRLARRPGSGGDSDEGDGRETGGDPDDGN